MLTAQRSLGGVLAVRDVQCSTGDQERASSTSSPDVAAPSVGQVTRQGTPVGIAAEEMGGNGGSHWHERVVPCRARPTYRDGMSSPVAFESVSTWQQPMPAPMSGARDEVVQTVASRVDALGDHRLRVAVDGRTAAGKTCFAHELARALRATGRPTLRASLDDFKRPWRDRHLYDRFSGEGYYRNAQDQDAVVDLLLHPAGPDGDGQVVLCSIDPLTQRDHREVIVHAPDDAVLVVDGVFALRAAYRPFWDLAVWLDVSEEESLVRGVGRDRAREGDDAAASLHQNRYAASERHYIADVDPRRRADVVVDNNRLVMPRIVRPSP